MTTKTTPARTGLGTGTAFLLTVPPLLWASNAVIGRMLRELVSPPTLNAVRWALALLLLLPLAAAV
ncbi:MAG TPA: EamA family transporter, partial [Burkholderiaceae bacterium]|nr:EamA family transporter [Burkholderiaceae bacterium]